MVLLSEIEGIHGDTSLVTLFQFEMELVRLAYLIRM